MHLPDGHLGGIPQGGTKETDLMVRWHYRKWTIGKTHPTLPIQLEPDQKLTQKSFRTTNGKVNETFWISREYYQLAKEYIDTKDDTFSVYSSDN